ncbi:hypothetical protein MTO96_037924 [Rhipicephalus appendiculatus]
MCEKGTSTVELAHVGHHPHHESRTSLGLGECRGSAQQSNTTAGTYAAHRATIEFTVTKVSIAVTADTVSTAAVAESSIASTVATASVFNLRLFHDDHDKH